MNVAQEQPLSLKHRIISMISSVGLFIIVVLSFYTIFRNGGTDSTTSSIMSVISGLIVGWIVLSLSGVLREFTLKGPFFEMTSKLANKIEEIRTEANDNKKEINSKIDTLNNFVQNSIQNINSRMDTVVTNTSQSSSRAETNFNYFYDEKKRKLDATLEHSGILAQEVEPNKKIPSGKLEQIDELMNKVDVLEKAIGKSTKPDLNELMKKGNFYFYKKDYDEAIKIYDEILNIYPKNISALSNKGVALGNLGKNEEAIKLYDKVLEIEPNDVIALTSKGASLGNLGKSEESIKLYDKALEIDPKDVITLSSKGVALGKLDKNEEAIKLFDKALEIDPNDARTLYNKSCNYVLMNDIENSLEFLKKTISLDNSYKKIAEDDPIFQKIRDKKEFKKLVGP